MSIFVEIDFLKLTLSTCDFFKKLFLINTSAANFSNPWKRLSWTVFLSSLKQLFTAKTEQFELNSLLVTTSLSQEKIVNEFRESYESVIQFSKKYPITKVNILRQLVAASYYFFPRESIGEVVLIRGAKDQFINSQCSVDLQKKWNCKILIHPTAGHDIAFEDANWLIEALKANILLDLGDRV